MEKDSQGEATDATTRNQNIRLAEGFELLGSEGSFGFAIRVDRKFEVGWHSRSILLAWEGHKVWKRT